MQPPDRREVCVGLFFNALSVCTRGQQVNNNNKPPGVRACTCRALYTSFPDIHLGPSSAHAWGGSCTSGASSAVCFRKSNPRMAGELVSWLPVAVRLHCTPVELDHRLFVAQNGSPPAGKSKVRGQGAGRREVYLRNGRSHRSPGCCDTAAKRSSSPERLPLLTYETSTSLVLTGLTTTRPPCGGLITPLCWGVVSGTWLQKDRSYPNKVDIK